MKDNKEILEELKGRLRDSFKIHTNDQYESRPPAADEILWEVEEAFKVILKQKDKEWKEIVNRMFKQENKGLPTKKQKEVLDFYEEFISKEERSPTYSEASKVLNESQSVVFTHVKRLSEKGLIKMSNKKNGTQVELVADEDRDLPGGEEL